jgi:DNA-binding transcriptional MerR regulator
VDKSPDAFRTISEVAEDLDLPQHVLRFWETRFSQIKPLKRGGGRRYYRPDDVDLLKGIRYYLYGEGYTIKGVQRILKDRGIRHVTEMGRAQNENYAPPVATIPRVEDEERRRERQDWPEATLVHTGERVAEPQPPLLSSTAAAVLTQARPPRIERLGPALSADSERRLRAALRDLTDCKRILDELL